MVSVRYMGSHVKRHAGLAESGQDANKPAVGPMETLQSPSLRRARHLGVDLGSMGDHVAPLGPDLGPCWTCCTRLECHARLLGADSKAMKILGSACSRNYIICTHLAPKMKRANQAG